MCSKAIATCLLRAKIKKDLRYKLKDNLKQRQKILSIYPKISRFVFSKMIRWKRVREKRGEESMSFLSLTTFVSAFPSQRC